MPGWKSRFRGIIATLLIVAANTAAADTVADDREVFLQSRTVVLGNMLGTPAEALRAALEKLQARGKPDVAAALILALRYNGPAEEYVVRALSAITGDTAAPGDDTGRTWFDWMLWQEAHPEITPHPSFRQIKREILVGIDPAFDRFLPLTEDATIRLEEIAWGGVRVDGIPALTNPDLIPATDADYLTPGELVFGIEINGDVRAYPLRILDWHEMLNDIIGGVPVSLGYCTLCGSGILFDTRIKQVGQPLVFGSSGLLYRSNKLMFDRQTGSLWNQFTGRPVSGLLAGSDVELRILPVAITSWRDWAASHPDTKVLSLETGYQRDYTPGAPYAHYFNSPNLMFPARADGETLPLKDYVFGIRTAGGARAWPLEDFRDTPVINDSVGLTDVVLVGNELTRTVRAYRREDRTFTPGPEPDSLSAGGEVWKIGEDALTGPDGAKLPRVAGHVAYSFAWSSFVGR